MLYRINSAAEISLRRHHWVKPMLLLALVGICFFAFCPEADASPGGQFVKQALSTKFGRIGAVIIGGGMLLLCLLLLPLILYAKYVESAGIRQTKKDLAVLAAKYSWFKWSTVRKRVEKAVRNIADVWASGDLSSVASFMTSEYHASQQALLRRWADEGNQIVYRLEKICRIDPLAVHVEDQEIDSWIRVWVTVNCVDYMRDKYTLGVVKGEVGTTSGFETVWYFVYRDGQWLLHGIEDGSKSLKWAMEKNHVDTSYLDYVGGKQRPQDRDDAKIPRRIGAKSQSTSLDATTNQPAAQPKRRLVRKPASDDDQ